MQVNKTVIVFFAWAHYGKFITSINKIEPQYGYSHKQSHAPKSSALYIRERIGVIAKGNIWAIVVPDTNTAVFFTNSERFIFA